MENIIVRAVGYFVLEADIPDQGCLAGDRIFVDDDPQTNARLIVAVWDNKAHLCQRSPSGALWDCSGECWAPVEAVVFGGALYYSRDIPGYKEATA